MGCRDLFHDRDEPMLYGLLADMMVFVHMTYVAYVLVGQFLICVAAPFGWAWARNPWFRISHLFAIAVVALEAVAGWRCPLTVWEEELRVRAGQPVTGETFLGRLLHNLLFVEGMPEAFFTLLYIAMLVVVVQGLVMYPPRWFRFNRTVRAPSSLGN